MSIIIGCDNAAFELKQTIKEHLSGLGYVVEDVGCGGTKDNTYYPEIASRLCTAIIDSDYHKRGILLCGTGLGMCITANKFPGIRAGVCHDVFSAERLALSNDGNVLCLGARVIGPELAKKMVDKWVDLHFIPGSSSPKVDAIRAIEKNNLKPQPSQKQ